MTFLEWYNALTDSSLIKKLKQTLGLTDTTGFKTALLQARLQERFDTSGSLYTFLGEIGAPVPAGVAPPKTPPMGSGESGALQEGDPGFGTGDGSAAVGEPDGDLLAALQQFLVDNELPLTLMDFIKGALTEGKPYAQIILELRERPEYKAAYPENDLRRANGFSWIPEAQIRQYRNDAKELAQRFGFSADNGEVANLIAKNVSLAEWERRIVATEQLLKYGPGVKQVLEAELGRAVDNRELLYFFMADKATPELDLAWENAAYRGRTVALGMGIRPEEEANLLRQYGVNPDQAFQGYQQVGQNLDRTTRLAAIDKAVNAQGFDSAAALKDASFGQLFRAIQLGDPTALRELQDLMSREVARNRQTSGVAFQGRVATGLLTEDELKNF